MTRRAVVIGGTGQIGRAIAEDLLAADWRVCVTHRGVRTAPASLIARGAQVIALDRDEPAALQRALGCGADALIDTSAYDLGHAQQLIGVQDCIGSIVVISSSSVYRDAAGRTLDEARQNGFPYFSAPIRETQKTVDPGPETYSTRKMALERHLLDTAKVPVAILRPCAVYGPGSGHPREWWFVKRMVDGRRAIPLAFRGASRFHTTSVLNIASLVRTTLENPGQRVLNIADPVALTVSEIATSIGRHLKYEGRFIELNDPAELTLLGRTPWSVPRPFTLDCSSARELGYKPVAHYPDAVGAVCRWLVETASIGDWKRRFPTLAGYPWDLFDYMAEERFFNA